MIAQHEGRDAEHRAELEQQDRDELGEEVVVEVGDVTPLHDVEVLDKVTH